MSFENPTSEVYFMTVPFSPDYKNVIDFNSKSEQESAFKNLSNKHFTNCNIIRKNKTLKITGDFGDYYKYNYMMFKNPELDSKWWYAFIIDSNYIGEQTTEIVFEIDVWQTFQFDATYYRSMIERGIVSRSNDDYKKWTQPEPLNIEAEYGKLLHTPNINWTPYYCIESISRYGLESALVAGTLDFQYGGEGSGENYSSLYMFPIGTSVDITKYKRTINAYGDLNDHRTDLIDIRIIPYWLTTSSGWNVINIPTSPDLYCYRYINNNNVCSTTTDDYDISSTTLANNYKPRNKKMLNSLCRSFMIYNLNGINIPTKPELYDNNKIKLTLLAKPIGLENVRITFENYSTVGHNYYDIPYNLTFNVSYNANTGIQKALGVFNASAQISKGVIGIIGSATLPTINPTSTIPVHSTQVDVPSSITLGGEINKGRIDKPLSFAGGFGDITSGGISLAQSLSTKSAGVSTTTDLLHYDNTRMKLHIGEYNPSLTNCQVVDQFLDMYGYSINESGNILDWTKTRSNWNYIKTNNCNIKINGDASYEQIFKNVFNNGVTIWHSFNAFGTYNTNRDDGITINQ